MSFKLSDLRSIPYLSPKNSSFMDFMRVYYKLWPLFLASITIFLCLGALYAYIKPPMYEIEANVLITDDDKDGNLMKSISLADVMLGSGSSAEQEMELMTSHTQFRGIAIDLKTNVQYVLRKNILKRIKKYSDSPIHLSTVTEIADTLRNTLTFKIGIDDNGLTWIKAKDAQGNVFADLEDIKLPDTLKTVYGDFIFGTTEYYKAGKPLRMNIAFTGYDQAAENLQKEINCVIPNRKAEIVSISYKTPNINFGKAVVNQLINEYNQQVITKNRQKAQRIADFLDQRIAQLVKDLNLSEIDIENYKKENKLTALEVDAEYFMTKRAEVETRLVESETLLQILEMTKQMMSDPQYQYAMIPVPTDAEAVAKLVGEYNELILERLKVESTAKPNSSIMRTLNEQIEAMRTTVLSSIDRQIASARIMVNDAKTEANKSNTLLGKVPTQERKYVEMKRNQQIIETLYLFMLQEREQASITIANALPKGVIIDHAYALSENAGLSKKAIYAIAFILGLLFVPALLFCIQLFEHKRA